MTKYYFYFSLDGPSIFFQCKDEAYDIEFINKYPSFHGYSQKNCFLLQHNEMLTSIFNCSMVYFHRLNNVRYCSPQENMVVWNPDESIFQRNIKHYLFNDYSSIYYLYMLNISFSSIYNKEQLTCCGCPQILIIEVKFCLSFS
jgi:hypothetical protein